MSDIATVLTDTARINEVPPWLRSECQRAADEINELRTEIARLERAVTDTAIIAQERYHEIQRLKAPRKRMPSIAKQNAWELGLYSLHSFETALAAHWGIELEAQK